MENEKKNVNISQVDENHYRTKDFYSAAVLLASGESLLTLEKTTHNFVIFIFNTPVTIAVKTLSSHWGRTLRIPTRDIIEAINELKTRMHETLNRQGGEL